MPLVSVIMPAYNASRFIAEAIESILNQTFPDFELLICDDGSTDDTLSIIKSYAARDNRINIFENKKNSGNLKTTNFLFSKCRGSYIAIQDADDFSSPCRFELQLKAFENDSALGIVGSNYEVVDENKSSVSCGLLPLTDGAIKSVMYKEVVPLLYASIMVKKEIADEVGRFRLFFNRIGSADFDWMARVIEKSDVINIYIPLYFYRKHSSQFTANYTLRGDYFLINMHAILVEAHKQRLRGEIDFIERADKLAMRKFIGNLYIKKAEDLYWSNLTKASFKMLVQSFFIFPFNLKLCKTTFFIFRKSFLN